MALPAPNRRDLLTGRALRDRAKAAQDARASAAVGQLAPEVHTPRSGATVRLTLRAMATEFGVLLNPGVVGQSLGASQALDVITQVEQQLTIYRDDSEVARLNAAAGKGPVRVSGSLFRLLETCEELTRVTDGAFDVATQSQILLWQHCKTVGRLPDDSEIESALASSGMSHLVLDRNNQTVAFDRPGIGINFGAIGKGYALDECEALMTPSSPEAFGAQGPGPTAPDDTSPADVDSPTNDKTNESIAANRSGIASFCLYGGHSSILARGDHNWTGGWPVGIGNPLFTSRRLGTILLRDRAFGTSGSNIQFYRHGGKRYGHILDPRTARPAGELLSVSVVAPTAAVADALSTAFFVLGVEKACAICDNQPLIGALLIPPPRRGGRLELVAVGIPDDIVFLDSDQVTVARLG